MITDLPKQAWYAVRGWVLLGVAAVLSWAAGILKRWARALATAANAVEAKA